MSNKKMGFNSRLIHNGGIRDDKGSAITPIYQTSTFQFDSVQHGAKCFSGESDGYIYTRIANPTIADLENSMADLENGYGGIATGSGMGAINTVYMTYLSSGSHVVCSDAVYGPSRIVLETIYKKFGVEVSFVDCSDVKNIANALRLNTKLIFIETPANPTMSLTDIQAVANLGLSHRIKVCVDNTFCSPYLQKPLDFGIDIVIHSMTKFINGHADVVAGMIITKTKDDYKKIRPVMVNMGCNMDPHQAYLTRRGLKTLSVRIEKAQSNCIKIAEFLNSHSKVSWVKFPGLKSFPQYELAKKQMKGPGAMISFGLKGGYKAGEIMLNNVELALLAVSLGGIETLIQHPASMTHSKMAKKEREQAGITDDLVRLSVGIEDVDDIIYDLEKALSKA